MLSVHGKTLINLTCDWTASTRKQNNYSNNFDDKYSILMKEDANYV